MSVMPPAGKGVLHWEGSPAPGELCCTWGLCCTWRDALHLEGCRSSGPTHIHAGPSQVEHATQVPSPHCPSLHTHASLQHSPEPYLLLAF